MWGISLALFLVSTAASAADPATTCYTLRDTSTQADWEYCVQPIVGKNAGMCTGLTMDTEDTCVAVGRKGSSLFPAAVRSGELSEILGDNLAAMNRLKPGAQTHILSIDTPDKTMVLVGTKHTPAKAQLPTPPETQKNEIADAGLRVSGLPVRPTKDWLKSVPDGMLFLIRTWLVKESHTRGKTNLKVMAEKAHTPACKTYLPMAVDSFQKAGVPKVAALAMVAESECDSNAQSSEGAVGLCQFMPDTARHYGLTVNATVDDRKNPAKCIPAAARYMKEHYDAVQDCPGTPIVKSMMMYNAGLPHLWKRGICSASDTKTMAWGGEPGEYARRILGMAYILDAGLTGDEVQSTRAPAPKKQLAKADKPRKVAGVVHTASGGAPSAYDTR